MEREKHVALTPRLQAIADMAPAGCRAADIGTDHAYLPIYLVQRKIAQAAIAVDNKEGPLEMARRNVGLHGLEGQIALRLGFGLAPVEPEEADVVVVAGMGGESIVEILEAARQDGRHFASYLLQPMSMEERLRRYMIERGFLIESERLVAEGEKLYTVMQATFAPESARKAREEECMVGTSLRQQHDPLLPEWVARRLASCRAALEQLASAGLEGTEAAADFARRVEILERVEGECKAW